MIIDFRMRPPARGFLNIGVYDNVERTAKLTECFSMKQAPSVAQKSPELMLQEMDTAGVTMGVIPGRNGHFKGTISNDDIIKLLGCGVEVKTKANKELSMFHLDGLRWNKIVICTDADVDGFQIRTLILTMLYRLTPTLIENGYVYAAVPPLFKLTRGKTTRLAFTPEERDQYSAELRGDNPNAKVDISRFKGLGEMDAHELWETTMDPTTRTLRRITLDDAVKADATFTVLMGEKVEPRKEFIERKAQYAVNLDY